MDAGGKPKKEGIQFPRLPEGQAKKSGKVGRKGRGQTEKGKKNPPKKELT